MNPPPIRILVVDDHPVVRKGLIAVLETEPGLEIVGEGRDGLEAVAQALTLQPDVILMDLVMPRLDGIGAIVKIKELLPETRILVLTSFTTADKVFTALRAGATGYMLKESDPLEVIHAIRQVYRSETYLHPTITRQVLAQVSPADLAGQKGAAEEELTERETEVARCITHGLSNAEIAEKLVVSEATVHTHINKILAKLHLANRTQVALFALKRGLVSLDEIA